MLTYIRSDETCSGAGNIDDDAVREEEGEKLQDFRERNIFFGWIGTGMSRGVRRS